jgi:glycosyltransferase involved in cell wall biosynthesis
MKVLWVSNSPAMPSGYGSQTRQVGRRIVRAGYELEFVANDGTRGDQEWEGLLVRGSGYDRYSRDTALEDLQRSGADWLVALYNAWVFTAEGWQDPFEGMPHVAAWVPIEYETVPLRLVPWFRQSHLNIAMSRHGYQQMVRLSEMFEGQRPGAGFPVRYAPHAVDDVFRPTEIVPALGLPFRKAAGIPDDAYLVGIVAANTGTAIYDRKGFGDMALSLAVFMHDRPDVWVYIHAAQQGFEAMNLNMLLGYAGVPLDRVQFADQYALKKHTLKDEDMAGIYSSFDVLLGTSRGEGFGLPHLEAQACGTPVILSNWTASAELVGDVFDPEHPGFQRHPSGWLVGCDRDWDPRQGGYFGKPLIPSIVRALSDAYEARGDASLRDAALAKAETYRADRVFDEHWKPILGDMERALQPVAPRAERRKAERAQKKGKRAA